jgi:hypothetical protein
MPQTSPISPIDNIVSLNNSPPPEITADAWFAEGRRVPYDHIAKEIVQSNTPANPKDIVNIFTRVIKEKHPIASRSGHRFYPAGLTVHSVGPRLIVHLRVKISALAYFSIMSAMAIPTSLQTIHSVTLNAPIWSRPCGNPKI